MSDQELASRVKQEANAVSLEIVENAEPIPGYVLRERLGAGGYGEVWKASAPGGLLKAIKFVHGRMDDTRAAREMKALTRIKEVRHPFLLSLERSDIIDGQLVVVTELADMSMMDRFKECREAGLPGIPREELLGYIRDAADALDYMSEKYGLQHLDIKPENLLLVGERVKVADFGLVKDLGETQVTTIGGVTPLYATPEAFDGKASPQSDQYSLAIVYQEMLTGVLPFPGHTTAQLAAQHLHSQPLLGPLPPADRPAVGRALSKQPPHRFQTCGAMVQALMGGQRAATEQPKSPAPEPALPLGRSWDSQQGPVVEVNVSYSLSDEFDKIDLEPISQFVGDVTNGKRLGLRPFVFLAAGGIGGRQLAGIRVRLKEVLGKAAALPIFQFVLVDTDQAALTAAQAGPGALPPESLVFAPLRKTSDYRGASDRLLAWLSRRWLYNIPRSQLTEGFRPLGRLAFVDHEERISAAVRKAIAEAASPAAAESANQAGGQPLRNAVPRVVVLGSLAGGASGGMVVDLGLLARRSLRELGLSDDGVCGLLSHFTSVKASTRDLLKTNSYATLTELHHFARLAASRQSGSKPPKSDAPDPNPFQDLYIAQLGDNLSDRELENAHDAVARYVTLDAASPCGAVLDHCRQLARQRALPDGCGPRVRAFGIHTVTCDKSRVTKDAVDRLCSRVISSWRGAIAAADDRATMLAALPSRALETASGELTPAEVAQKQLAAAGLEVDAVSRKLQAMATKELKGDIEGFFRELIASVLAEQGKSKEREPLAKRLGEVQAILDAVLGASPNSERLGAPKQTRLEIVLQERAKRLSADHVAMLSKTLVELVNTPGKRIAAALPLSDALKEGLRTLKAGATDLNRSVQTRLAELRRKLDGAEAPAAKKGWWFVRPPTALPQIDIEKTWNEYAQFRLCELVLRNVAGVFQSASSQFAATREQFVRFRRLIEDQAKAFAPEEHDDDDDGQPATPMGVADIPHLTVLPAPPVSSLDNDEFVCEFDRKFQQEVLDPLGGLMVALTEIPHEAAVLRAALHERAVEAVRAALHGVDAARTFLEAYPRKDKAIATLAECAAKADASTDNVANASRLFVILPDGDDGRRLGKIVAQGLPNVAATLFDGEQEIIMCREAEHISLAKLANTLIDHRDDYAEAARRMLTRVDVAWAAIPQPRLDVTQAHDSADLPDANADDAPENRTQEPLDATIPMPCAGTAPFHIEADDSALGFDVARLSATLPTAAPVDSLEALRGTCPTQPVS